MEALMYSFQAKVIVYYPCQVSAQIVVLLFYAIFFPADAMFWHSLCFMPDVCISANKNYFLPMVNLPFPHHVT
jgi:hypothetical protein